MKIKIFRPTEEQLKTYKISTWNKWECEPSVFEWEYNEEEEAYIFEGKVKVKTVWEEVEIKGGDFVVFPKGLKCTWTVINTIKKVYNCKI